MATKAGTILTEKCKLVNLLYVQNLRNNLFSIYKIEQNGFVVKFDNNEVNLCVTNRISYKISRFKGAHVKENANNEF